MDEEQLLKRLESNPAEGGLALRSSLALFIGVFHWYLTHQRFTFKGFHLELINRLQRLVTEPERHRRNLYIGMPPRFGKTQTVKYFIAWCYALNGSCNFILTSYGLDLVLSSSKGVKEVIQSPLYQKLFGVRLDSGSTAADLWKISGGGEFRAATLDSVIRGFGAGVKSPGFGGAIVIDDFLKSSTSKSEKQSVIQIYNDSIKSRINKPETPIIIIAQRLAVDDLIGWIEENEREDWDFYLIKAYDEESGESVWPELMPVEKLMKMRDIVPGVYWSQYQQEPIIVGGGVFRTEWWQYYNPHGNYEYRRIYICADTAMKTGEQNDFTVLGAFGVEYSGQVHLLDLVHCKVEAPELERVFMSFWEKWRYNAPYRCRCSAVYVEDKASGIGLIQSVRRRGIPVIAMRPTRDKYSRVMEALPSIESGVFRLPGSASDAISRQVIAEAEAFSADMSHRHDDIIDVICYGIDKAGHGGFF